MSLAAILLVLSACAPKDPATVTPGVTLEGTLRPYPSNTATQTPLPTGYVTPTPSPTITPTWTPVYYKVGENDDMFGISLWYGVSLEALKTANPTVLPYAMGVGTVLLIPLTPQAESTPRPTPVFTPTPTAPYSLPSSPACYPDGFNGLTCFALVTNDSDGIMENVTGIITITDQETGDILEQSAIMPLNLLRVGESLPVVAYFPAPLPDAYTASFAVDLVLPFLEGDARYADVTISSQEVTYAADRTSAVIKGSLSLANDEKEVRSIRLLAIAYDTEDLVLGIRVWDSPDPASLSISQSQEFTLNLYSLAGAIDHIDLIAEAKAVTP